MSFPLFCPAVAALTLSLAYGTVTVVLTRTNFAAVQFRFQDMEVGVVKIAEDSDFNMLKDLIDRDDDWKLEYDKGENARVICSN